MVVKGGTEIMFLVLKCFPFSFPPSLHAFTEQNTPRTRLSPSLLSVSTARPSQSLATDIAIAACFLAFVFLCFVPTCHVFLCTVC
jgi:hypothetical protein